MVAMVSLVRYLKGGPERPISDTTGRMTRLPTLSVVIMACAREGSPLGRLQQSLHDSDVGRQYRVVLQRRNQDLWDHWRTVHRTAAACGTDMVLVLEDDAIVNRHIAHNIQTWYWPWSAGFGCGFVYNPGGYCQRDTWYQGPNHWFGTVGVVYQPKLLERVIDPTYETRKKWGGAFDNAVTQQVLRTGKKIRVHYPALVEHLDDTPSAMGHPRAGSMRTSRGTFDANFRRKVDHPHTLLQDHGRLRLPPGPAPEWATRVEAPKPPQPRLGLQRLESQPKEKA